jgi:GT2 family glycosyltransferase
MNAISLIIATRNRAQKLSACLSHVARVNTQLRWELIVVDNGSTDRTQNVLEEFARSASFPVTLLYEDTPGLGRAQNRAWRVGKGEIIAFTDDDCYVSPTLLDEVVKVFEDARIGYCGGRIILLGETDAPGNLRTFPPNSYLPAGAIEGANLMFRRSTLEAIGGFDEAFGPGTPFNCVDVDACARASFAGWWGAWAPGPTVIHDHGRNRIESAIASRSYAIGRGAYSAKFIIRSDTRRRYLRSWVLALAKQISRRGRRRDFFLEIQGALHYSADRLFKRYSYL